MIAFWDRWKPYIFKNAFLLLLTLLIAFSLKYHYSRADSDDLAWILAPTAEMVEQVSGIQFAQEQHTGFVSQNCRIIIAPACAGINFMLMAYCMATFCGVNYFGSSKSKIAWIIGCLAGSYALTIVVNTTRIIIAMALYDADIYSVWVTPQRVHRLEGTLIYFLALRVFYILISWTLLHFANGPLDNRMTDTHTCGNDNGWRRWTGLGLVPLFWYVLIALGIPLLNFADRPNQSLPLEHIWMVISGSMAVFFLLFLMQSGYQRIKDFVHHLKSG